MSIDRPRARTREGEAQANRGEQQMQLDCSMGPRQHPELEHADEDRHNGGPQPDQQQRSRQGFYNRKKYQREVWVMQSRCSVCEEPGDQRHSQKQKTRTLQSVWKR